MTQSHQNVVLGQGEGKMITLPGHKITHKVSGLDTNGAYSMLEVELDGDGPPLHIHKSEDESFYVLEGEIKLLVGERNIRATAGSLIFVPKGTIHTFSQIGHQPAKFLVTYSPSGFEKFFDEAVGLGEMDTEGYITKANALADKYNMEVVGPPIR